MTDTKERPPAKTTDTRDRRSKKVVGGIAPNFNKLNKQLGEHVGDNTPIKVQVKRGIPFWKR